MPQNFCPAGSNACFLSACFIFIYSLKMKSRSSSFVIAVMLCCCYIGHLCWFLHLLLLFICRIHNMHQFISQGEAVMILIVIISASLSVNIASVNANGVDRSPSPSVGLCMCLWVGLSVGWSGKCTVAKRLIGSGCRLGWWMGLVEGWVY